ncbi:hydantoinase B/oxoprolinase family protein [Chloroflexota bacterium]
MNNMREKVDPITLEVIHHRLESIAEEMLTSLLKASFSTIVKEGRDATSALFDAKGRIIAQSAAIPIHIGTMIFSVPQIITTFPIQDAQDGDVYLANDPYSGGTHLPDITLVTPVIHQGEVLALSASMVHHQDMGGIKPGVPTSATSLYHEGLCLPPIKLYDAGEPVKAVIDIIRKNVRVPDAIIGDLHAQVASGNVGKVRLKELFNEYSREVVIAAIEQLLDSSETLTRDEIEKIPNGTYSFIDYMDNDGIDLDKRIKVQASITIDGSNFTVDFSGTSHQVKGPCNCVPSSTNTCIGYVLRAITGAEIPTNDGCFRPIKSILPKGSLVNPYYPAACGMRATTMYVICHALMGALVKAVPERLTGRPGCNTVVYFGGIDPLTGKEYVMSQFLKGGSGARATKDGVDTIASTVSNTASTPFEATEMTAPVRVVESRLIEDSGGAGKYRGGLGKKQVFELLRGDEVSLTFRGEDHFTSPWGILGGLPARRAEAFVIRKTGEKERIQSKQDYILSEGDALDLSTAGGGGYGDPLERDAELVLSDVLDGKVSLKAARNDYGVSINKESMRIDVAKTIKLRNEKAKLRGPITWTHDRGPDGKE